MKSLPANLILAKNSLQSTSAWLILLDITLTDGTVLRYVRNPADITYQTNTYTALAFEIDPAIQSSTGEIPTVSLRVSNVTQVLMPYMQSLNGGVGSVVKITVVSSDDLAEDHSELEIEYEVLSAKASAQWVTWRLGAPRFPQDRYLDKHCRFRYETAECAYSRKTVADVTLSGSNPVSVEVTAHGFATGDSIRLAGIAGITPDMAASYTITKTDADNFTLDSTDSSDYSGAYTSGGTAGYADCSRTLAACRDRENEDRFGNCPGLKPGGLRVA